MTNYDPRRILPLPTETIEINIIATVNKRDSYKKQINHIVNCVLKEFVELNIEHMNSPLKIRIKKKSDEIS